MLIRNKHYCDYEFAQYIASRYGLSTSGMDSLLP